MFLQELKCYTKTYNYQDQIKNISVVQANWILLSLEKDSASNLRKLLRLLPAISRQLPLRRKLVRAQVVYLAQVDFLDRWMGIQSNMPSLFGIFAFHANLF